MRGLGRRFGAVVFAAMALAAFAGCQTPAVSAPGPTPRPRVLITIVVDQMAAWMAEERWPALPAEGGFARLRREGLTVWQLRYAHAVTDTAPGHAALYTGAVPRDSGIFANEILGPDGKPRSILLDETTKLVETVSSGEHSLFMLTEKRSLPAERQVIDRPGSSLARLRVETLADVLVAETPGAEVYSFSLKDRGALFAAGRHPTATVWLDLPSERFASSTAFPDATMWEPGFEHQRLKDWRLEGPDRAWVLAHAETPDDQAGEGDLAGLGTTFPHFGHAVSALRATPFPDEFLLTLLGNQFAFMRMQLRAGKVPVPTTLLAVSLSSNDYVNHVFGPHSWEAWDALLQLDRRLAALLTQADRVLGPDGYAVMLTSDHGGGALPEVTPEAAHVACGPRDPPDRWERPCARRRRIAPSEMIAKLESALAAEIGQGPWVVGFAEPLVYLAPRARDLDAPTRDRLVRAAAAALAPMGVRAVVDAWRATQPCPPIGDESLDALVCRSIDPTGPGDLYLVVEPGAFFDPGLVPGAGTSHGSPYLYDRAVPLIVRAPSRVPPGAERRSPVAFTAFARTAAALLGIRPPAGARDGENLAP
jgi:Type I phosphodiesterase / nucleotide pyrophosphatase